MTARPGPRATPPGLLRIGDAARAVGVSPSTLRLWERQGLVAPQRPGGGERRYGPDELTRLRCVRRLRSVEGLNAAGIRRALGRDDEAAPPLAAGVGPVAAKLPKLPAGPGPAPAVPHGGASGDPGSATLVGARLRALRTTAGLSLREVAARTGLSASSLSGLERGLGGGSVAALARLASLYGTTVPAIVAGPTAGSPGPGAAPADDRVVRDGARTTVEAGPGVRIEELAVLPTHLQPQLFVLSPGAASDGAHAHAGEGFLYVLRGRVAVWLDEREHHELGPGDALTFPSSLPYRFVALGADETRILWVNTPPTL